VSSADLEVGDTAGLETCATTDRQFEAHPLASRRLTILFSIASVCAF